MKTTLVVGLALLLLAGCGSSPPSPPAHSARNAQFDDPRMQALWSQAQQTLATQPITLNAALVAEGSQQPVTIAPDPRAIGVTPDGVTVTLVPDLTVAQLQAENPGVTLQHNTDPTGVIHAPDGSSARYCASYTQGNAVFVAQSLEYSANATGYEFQNIILERLGYNISGR